MLLWCRSKLDGPVPPLAPHCFPWPLCLAKVNMHVCALHAFFTKCEAVCAVRPASTQDQCTCMEHHLKPGHPNHGTFP